MKKIYMGARLRRLREERGLTQAALSAALTISPSYLNQIEQNQRPLTIPVLLKLNAVLGLDVQLFAEGDSARLVAELKAALQDQGTSVSASELRDFTANMPHIARSIVKLHARLREESERADLMAGQMSDSSSANPLTNYEPVRDWFYHRRNHVPVLDRAAEAIGAELPIGAMLPGLKDRLGTRHGIHISTVKAGGTLRKFDPTERLLNLSSDLDHGQKAFQIATQIALIEQNQVISEMLEQSGMTREGQGLLRIGLANYFAGALLMPYRLFLAQAEDCLYDVDALSRQFGVSTESIYHRLSTLQKDGASGVPFFFIRVDRAGNISKRQSATDFHFSRIGGSCPLWNIYESFSRPGEILRQIAQMPDGRSYLWISRLVTSGTQAFGAKQKTFAIALGCDLSHADKLVYSRGLDLNNLEQRVLIGPGCKLCEREDCHQRAFPFIGAPLKLDPTQSQFAPYC